MSAIEELADFGRQQGASTMTTIALIIILAVVQFMLFTAITGFSRVKYGVNAPKTTGNDDWERRFRVQQNTMEHLVAFVPAIYLCATYTSHTLALICGVLYLIGRCHYAYSYIKAPPTRALGMMLSFFPTAIMALAALGGIVWSLLG